MAVFGMGETATDNAARLVEALEQAVTRLPGERDAGGRELMPPPPWGPLEMTPARGVPGRRRRWCRSSDAVGRIAAESLAAYPPGIPNVLPGERLTAETLGVRAGDPRPRREPARSQRPHAAHGARGGGGAVSGGADADIALLERDVGGWGRGEFWNGEPYADDVVFVRSGPDGGEYHGIDGLGAAWRDFLGGMGGLPDRDGARGAR